MLDRRFAPRFTANQAVQVTLLEGSADRMPGVITDVSGGGMRIVLDGPLPNALAMDAPVRVDLPDSMVLGEVCYCQRHGDGFAIGIQMQHSLLNLAELTRLRSQFLGAGLSRR
jgi:hypothetical protein